MSDDYTPVGDFLATIPPERFNLDCGAGVWLAYYRWAPDDLPQNRATYNIPDGQPMPVVERAGALFYHLRKDDPTRLCLGSAPFAGRVPNHTGAEWEVVSEDPLTLSPSILCRECGRHGFVQQGRWVEA